MFWLQLGRMRAEVSTCVCTHVHIHTRAHARVPDEGKRAKKPWAPA
jgi:hypothetical protein